MLNGSRDAMSSYERPGRDLELEARINEHITAGEAHWLKERMMRNGHICANQKALLRFIREESANIQLDLQKLLDKAA